MSDHENRPQFDRIPEDPEQVPDSIYSQHDFEDPDFIFGRQRRSKFSLSRKKVTYGALILVIIALNIAGYLIITGRSDDQERATTAASAATPTPPAGPTATKPPNSTPQPTATPLPTAAPAAVLGDQFIPPNAGDATASADDNELAGGTAEPALFVTDHHRSLIAAFASCNGVYTGADFEARRNAAHETIVSGVRSPTEMLEIAINACGYTAENLPTPAPTTVPPTTVASASPTSVAPTPEPEHHMLLMELRTARSLAQNRPELLESISTLPWTLAPMPPPSARVAQQLLYIAGDDYQLFETLIAMPFLTEPDDADYHALRSLRYLKNHNPATFQNVMQHPTISAGITDAWTPAVAALQQHTTPRRLLDPSTVSVQRDVYHTTSGSTVDVAVIRISGQTGSTATLGHLTTAIDLVERNMGQPLPTESVVLLLDPIAKAEHHGHYLSTYISVQAVYDDPADLFHSPQLPMLLAHEVAHYYWNDNRIWLDEGIATVIAYNVETQRTGAAVNRINYPCPEAANLSQLEAMQAQGIALSPHCEYSLGERLFLELQQIYGPTQFRQMLGQLHALGQPMDSPPLGIEHVRQVFGGDPSAAERIEHWYLGVESADAPPIAERIDISDPNPALPEINGTVTQAYLSLEYQGQPVNQFSASLHQQPAYVNVHYAHHIPQGSLQTELEFIEYFEDGFAVKRTPYTITADSQHSGGTLWIPVGPYDGTPWRVGSYWTMVYNGSHKVAQIHWTVHP